MTYKEARLAVRPTMDMLRLLVQEAAGGAVTPDKVRSALDDIKRSQDYLVRLLVTGVKGRPTEVRPLPVLPPVGRQADGSDQRHVYQDKAPAKQQRRITPNPGPEGPLAALHGQSGTQVPGTPSQWMDMPGHAARIEDDVRQWVNG